MANKRQLNGGDYLMLAFDYELRRRQFAGNNCQIILELAAPADADALRQHVRTALEKFPFLAARPAGFNQPHWQPVPLQPQVRQHTILPDLLNEPLDLRHGELFRFDLAGTTVVFTWAHALMDAKAAEHFVTGLGRGDFTGMSAAPSVGTVNPFGKQLAGARQASGYITQFSQKPPRPFHPPDRQQPPRLSYHVDKFTGEETAQIRANAAKACGFLNTAQFDAATTLFELHRLHQRLNTGSPSYLFPLPVGLRPKGSLEPLFSNQIAMLMLQFFPAEFESLTAVVAALKSKTENAMRNGHLDHYVLLAEFSRYLPVPVCLAIMKYKIGGELASIFYGDAGTVNPALSEFLGVPVTDVIHLAAVLESPGLGVIFGRFKNQLRLTTVHNPRLLTAAAAAQFAADLRHRLLTP
ncbi:MAG: hypothetical protein PCFJNLEI_04119 [Verrucomicrobiae bacterium]|nr:hypothetical protein [Verrucomicrobiae bacterium]